MATQKWMVEIGGDSSGAQSAVSGLSVKTVALGNILADVAAAAFRMATEAVSNLAGEINKSVWAAADAQESQMALADAMRKAGTYTTEAYNAAMNYASALQESTTYGDDNINTVQAALSVYKLEGETLNELTRLTLDLATAKKIDLTSAAEMVAKSIGTSRNALKAYGVEVTDTTDKNVKAKEVIEGLTNLYGGRATSATVAFNGKVKQLKEIWGDLYEEIGNVIINNETFVALMGRVKQAILDATKYVIEHKDELGKFVKDGIVGAVKGLNSLATSLNTVITSVAFFGTTIATAVNGIRDFSDNLDIVTIASRFFGTQHAKDLDKASKARSDAIKSMEDFSAKQYLLIEESKKGLEDLIKMLEKTNTSYTKNGEVALTTAQIAAEALQKRAAEEAQYVAEMTIWLTDLQDKARGYTQTQLEEYQKDADGMYALLLAKKITQEEYDAWYQGKQKIFFAKDAENFAKRKEQYLSYASTISSISQTQADALITGQKNLGTALEDAWKQTARKLIDAFIDEKVKEIAISAATETGKATVAAPLSFGTSLLLIPIIAVAATLAKAAIHAIAGFSEGGIVGAGGKRIPLPSAGFSSSAPDDAIATVRTGEVIGTPRQLAASGIGGITVHFNNYGAIGSDVDLSNIGNLLGFQIQNKLRGAM